jgi:hypothetical protein
LRENYGSSLDLLAKELIAGVNKVNYNQNNMQINALAGRLAEAVWHTLRQHAPCCPPGHASRLRPWHHVLLMRAAARRQSVFDREKVPAPLSAHHS